MSAAPTPDVTVVVAVYNTMPYLTECLTSVTEQTLGRERLEVVAVDDGSSDGSGEELDRFAALYPGTIRVVHQENSGGPAAPSNWALELARGRYVFFLGADDHLGPEALSRLVERADALDADVMIGKMTGVNGRYVHQALYQESRDDIRFTDSALPWTLSNTKLFRRSMVEEHHIRFPEDLLVGSDQPFTVEACVRARRIAVLGDYTYYYAVRRGDAQNITYRSLPETRLACTRRIMELVAAAVPPGPDRDAVLLRHFSWELSKLTERGFLELSVERQEALRHGIAELADRYWTPAMQPAVPVAARVRLALARTGSLDALVRAVEQRFQGVVPVLLEKATTGEPAAGFAELVGFRDPALGLDDSVYAVGEHDLSALLAPGVRAESLRLARRAAGGGVLRVGVRTEVRADPDDRPSMALGLADRRMPASSDPAGARRLPVGHPVNRVPSTVGGSAGPAGSCHAVASVDLLPLLRTADEGPVALGLRMYPELGGRTYEIPVRVVDGAVDPVDAIVWRGLRPYRLTVEPNDKGRLVLRLARSPWRLVARRALRRDQPRPTTA